MGSFSFRLGSIPVRVQGPFLLMTVMLGLLANKSPLSVAIFVAIFLLSVMVHELGHAFTGMAFGLRPQIDLHGIGGTTSWLVDPGAAQETRQRLSPTRSILVSLAGPCSGLLLGALVVAADRLLPAKSPLLQGAVDQAKAINIVLNIFNLLPILPLDGGNVLASAVRGITSRSNAQDNGRTGVRGQIGVRYWSIALALLLGVVGLRAQFYVAVGLAVVFVVQNLRGIALLRRLEGEAPLHDAVTKGKEAVDARDGRRAISYGETIVREAITMEMRREGLMLLAYGRLLEGQWAQLMQLLGDAKVEFGAGELSRFETTVRDLGRTEDADQIRAWVYQAAGFKT
jgi:Zn-dependent protease